MDASGDFTPIEGGCACGDVRFRMESAPIIVHGCHCRFCQRTTGSPMAVNAMIEADRLTMLTPVRPDVVHTPSALPEGQKFHRCPRCRVMLWTNHALLGERIALVATGVLDEPSRIVPDVHCFTATKHPWMVLPEGVPAFPGDYDPDGVWSDEVKSRLAAAMEG